MTSKSRGHCDNIKVFNQGKSNQIREKSGNLIAKNCVATLFKLKLKPLALLGLNYILSILGLGNGQFMICLKIGISVWLLQQLRVSIDVD